MFYSAKPSRNSHMSHHDHLIQSQGKHHDHHHHHGSVTTTTRAFAIGVVLNMVFVIIEVIFGLASHSLSLLADAGHNFSDVIGLLLAWFATVLARKPPSGRFTFGLGGSTILAALANSMLLLLAVGAIAWEAVHRIQTPFPVNQNTMMGVALVGVFINVFTALLLRHGDDINKRAAYWHMVADAAVSAGVVLAGLGISLTGWFWLDPVISLVIAGVILAGTWGLFRQSLHLSLQAVPEHINVDEVFEFLRQQEGVSEVHDLHIWAMSTTENALTAHIIMPDGHPGDSYLTSLTHLLRDTYHIHHSTIQIEIGNTDVPCSLAPASIV